VHFISIEFVLSVHLSYVTIFDCSHGRSHKTGLTHLFIKFIHWHRAHYFVSVNHVQSSYNKVTHDFPWEHRRHSDLGFGCSKISKMVNGYNTMTSSDKTILAQNLSQYLNQVIVICCLNSAGDQHMAFDPI
jgi:hypothetical protein